MPHQNYPSRAMPANSPNTTSSQSSNQSTSGEPLSRTNLYIRGLNPNTTDKDLVNLCNSYVFVIFMFPFLFPLITMDGKSGNEKKHNYNSSSWYIFSFSNSYFLHAPRCKFLFCCFYWAKVVWFEKSASLLIRLSHVNMLSYLISSFHRFGKITSTKAIIDQTTNKCKGMSFKCPPSMKTALLW